MTADQTFRKKPTGRDGMYLIAEPIFRRCPAGGTEVGAALQELTWLRAPLEEEYRYPLEK